jgi:hypothetical protein
MLSIFESQDAMPHLYRTVHDFDSMLAINF